MAIFVKMSFSAFSGWLVSVVQDGNVISVLKGFFPKKWGHYSCNQQAVKLLGFTKTTYLLYYIFTKSYTPNEKLGTYQNLPFSEKAIPQSVSIQVS